MYRFAITLLLCLGTCSAQASLLGRAPLTPGGTDYQAYYDTVLKITWVADGTLSKTTGYDGDGRMNWAAAQTWIESLNAGSYLGVSGWRLPTILDTNAPGCQVSNGGTDCGYNPQTIGRQVFSEMATLYYLTLGNVALTDTTGGSNYCPQAPIFCLVNTGPFSNLQPSAYWSGTTAAFFPDRALRFDFNNGYQTDSPKIANFFVLPVTAGDPLAAPVPVPASIALFGSALGVTGLLRRKRGLHPGGRV
jgi:hypothetical protein